MKEDINITTMCTLANALLTLHTSLTRASAKKYISIYHHFFFVFKRLAHKTEKIATKVPQNANPKVLLSVVLIPSCCVLKASFQRTTAEKLAGKG